MFKRKSLIFDEVVRINHAYLGPEADSFIIRQIENHLHKSPRQLTCQDLNGMIDWMKAVVALMNEDTDKIEEYVQALQNLANSSELTQKLNYE